jgi:hypothetical protein
MICLWGAAQAKADAWIALLALSAAGLVLYAIAARSLRLARQA